MNQTPRERQPGSGDICSIHHFPYMPVGWPDTLPPPGTTIDTWSCPQCDQEQDGEKEILTGRPLGVSENDLELVDVSEQNSDNKQ